MNKTDSIASLSAALAEAQGEIQSARFDSVNPFLKNKYASLGSINEVVRPVLAKHELAFSQHPVNSGPEFPKRIGVETILIHSSGEYMGSVRYMETGNEKGKSSAQVLDSIITYLRRYALASILGVYADDDGRQRSEA